MHSYTSEGKRFTRESDLDLIKVLAKKARRKLSYLGLPSPFMGDVADWRPHLGDVIAIEKEKIFLSHLMDKAYALGLFDCFEYFLGDIDDIIQSGCDDYGKTITNKFPVDLINLDYFRGLDYRGFRKLSTLEAVLDRQKASLLSTSQVQIPYFIVLLTHNIPKNEGDPQAKDAYLKYLGRNISDYGERTRDKFKTALDWYLSKECPAAYQHKCFVIGKMIEFGSSKGFKIVPKSTIQYFGDKDANMLHSQFEVRISNLKSPVPTDPMSPIDILDLPVVDEYGNELSAERPKIRT